MKEAYEEVKLELNEKKTKIMLVGKQTGYIKESLKKTHLGKIELVMEFKYLGMIINNLGLIRKDVEKKIDKVKNLTSMLRKWRYNGLGMINCLILW